LVVDGDLVPARIGLGAELGHDDTVNGDAPFSDHYFCGSARCYAPRREDALQSFQSGSPGEFACLAENQRALSNKIGPGEE
jgi:hypothetical protein